MTEPLLSPCAALVRKLDPDLFRAALFAAEPLRERLMVLLAFDIELSKAAGRTAEPVIAAMRVQFWRDVIEEAFEGAQPRAHEVAKPLARLIADHGLSREPFEQLFEACELEIGTGVSVDRFTAWQEGRVTPLLMLGAELALGTRPEGRVAGACQAMGEAMALAFALRNAVAMARDGRFLLPLAGLDRAALSRGERSESLERTVADLAGPALARLREAKIGVPGKVRPVLRLGYRAEAVLKAASAPDFDILRARSIGAQGGSLRLLGLSLTGRW